MGAGALRVLLTGSSGFIISLEKSVNRLTRPIISTLPRTASRQVRVRRTGGFVGRALEASVDLDSDDDRAPVLQGLVGRIDTAAVTASGPRPDHFTYEFDLGGDHVAVHEQDLTSELRDVADLVLRRDPGGSPQAPRE